jgi:SAM-dependent methyltransferase
VIETFPPGFFDRADETTDSGFYRSPRFVTHIDDRAISAVSDLYDELGIAGTVLDLMSSWVSHFRTPPARLIGVGMNAGELAANPAMAEHVVRDLNADPTLPFGDGTIDHAVCCVSVDYLVRPVELFAEVGRVLRPGGLFVNTFSNRCFPSKVIRGWLATDDATHVEIVKAYYRLSGAFSLAEGGLRNPGRRGDPLYGVFARAEA